MKKLIIIISIVMMLADFAFGTMVVNTDGPYLLSPGSKLTVRTKVYWDVQFPSNWQINNFSYTTAIAYYILPFPNYPSWSGIKYKRGKETRIKDKFSYDFLLQLAEIDLADPTQAASWFSVHDLGVEAMVEWSVETDYGSNGQYWNNESGTFIEDTMTTLEIVPGLTNITIVPEPAAILLLGFGAVILRRKFTCSGNNLNL